MSAIDITKQTGRWYYQRKTANGIDIVGPIETHKEAKAKNQAEWDAGRIVSPVYWAGGVMPKENRVQP